MKKDHSERKVRINISKKRAERKLTSKRKRRHRQGTGYKKAD